MVIHNPDWDANLDVLLFLTLTLYKLFGVPNKILYT